MGQFTDIEQLEGALTDLGELMDERGLEYAACVIGGAAFLLQEPNRHHATADVDIAAVVSHGQLVSPGADLPGAIQRSVDDIARIRGLRRGWVSTAAAAAFGVQLPDGFLARASERRFGGLTVHVASRDDLIKLKLLAAVSRKGAVGERHLADLSQSHPSSTELTVAATWVRTQLSDPDAFADTIARSLRRLEDSGHG